MTATNSVAITIAAASALIALASMAVSTMTYRRGAPRIKLTYEDFSWNYVDGSLHGWPTHLEVQIRVTNIGAVRTFAEEAGVVLYTRVPKRRMGRRGHLVGWKCNESPLLVDSFDSEVVSMTVPLRIAEGPSPIHKATVSVEARAFVTMKTGKKRRTLRPIAARQRR
ncbi:hypothetical protein [Micromonospora sp. CMU55-4]|uniref:hypothetical protein n=1 Tax=Micromonospora sp. CMU55-4 TaxID=2717028 RepID=UPI00140997A6|nr:hypothetical protein [Micromonospora sp. CMU55-4]NHO84396.1 hypothetical protein [Micromonospora sp. CMU55-4]